MKMATGILWGVLILWITLLAAWVCTGIYVYRDAKSRGMHAVLWTLAVLLIPLWIGFLLYLLARGSYPALACPQCHKPVTAQYIACPGCGARLKPSCPGCGAPVEPDWKVCPYCAQPLPDQTPEVTPPVPRRDRGLKKVLLGVLLVPLVLLVAAILSFVLVPPSAGATGFARIRVDAYEETARDERAVEWLDSIAREYETAYVLCWEETSDGQAQAQYLIYLPCLAEDASVSAGTRRGLLGNDTLEVSVEDTGGNAGNTLLMVTSTRTSEKLPELAIYLGDRKISYEFTQVDYMLW